MKQRTLHENGTTRLTIYSPHGFTRSACQSSANQYVPGEHLRTCDWMCTSGAAAAHYPLRQTPSASARHRHERWRERRASPATLSPLQARVDGICTFQHTITAVEDSGREESQKRALLSAWCTSSHQLRSTTRVAISKGSRLSTRSALCPPIQRRAIRYDLYRSNLRQQ